MRPRWPRAVLTLLVSLQILVAGALAVGGALLALSASHDSSSDWAGLVIAIGVVGAVVGFVAAGLLISALVACRRASPAGRVFLLCLESIALAVAVASASATGTTAGVGSCLILGAAVALAAYETAQPAGHR